MNVKAGKYWFSCPKFTIAVVVNDASIIIDGASFIKGKDNRFTGKKGFLGQPFENLIRWGQKFGEVKYEKIS